MQDGDVAKALHAQLRAAFDASGLTMGQVLALSGLECDESSLGRKLNGKQLLRADECEALAAALRVKITTGRAA